MGKGVHGTQTHSRDHTTVTLESTTSHRGKELKTVPAAQGLMGLASRARAARALLQGGQFLVEETGLIS